MQIRMNTDADMKRAIDTNLPEWNNFTVAQAITKIRSGVSNKILQQELLQRADKVNITIDYPILREF